MIMEDWQIDFEWLRIRHQVKDDMSCEELPDLQIILLLIGVQESNIIQTSYTKEEKQDLMHVATCHLLSLFGFYEYVGKDDEGWPHYRQVQIVPAEGEKAQERLLKESIISYFGHNSTINSLVHEN